MRAFTAALRAVEATENRNGHDQLILPDVMIIPNVVINVVTKTRTADKIRSRVTSLRLAQYVDMMFFIEIILN